MLAILHSLGMFVVCDGLGSSHWFGGRFSHSNRHLLD